MVFIYVENFDGKNYVLGKLMKYYEVVLLLLFELNLICFSNTNLLFLGNCFPVMYKEKYACNKINIKIM